MRKILLLAPALLAACTTGSFPPESPTGAQSTPIHGVTPGHKCEAAGTGRFVGQTGNSETGALIMRATHAAVLRWAPRGYMLTMDYREDRVTVHLGPDYKVTEIKCG